jgi:hypothetical protein
MTGIGRLLSIEDGEGHAEPTSKDFRALEVRGAVLADRVYVRD